MNDLPEGYTIERRGMNGAWCFVFKGELYGHHDSAQSAIKAAHDHHDIESNPFPEARRWAQEFD